MRLDKYLKTSRLIKRRVVAKEACEQGRVMVNGRSAKAGFEVSPGDRLEIRLGERLIRIEIIEIRENVSARDAAELYKIIEG